MTPEATALACKWGREGLTRNQVRVIFSLLMDMKLDDLGLSDTSYKRTTDELLRLKWIYLHGNHFRLAPGVLQIFRADEGPWPAPPATVAAQPPTVTGSADPPASAFNKRPANQKLWARKMADLAGLSQDEVALEALALRKFGKVS